MKSNVNSNLFFSYYGDDKKNKNTIFTTKFKIIGWIIFVAIIIVSFVMVGFNYSPYGFKVFINNLTKIFSFDSNISLYPNQSLWVLSIEFLWLSLEGVVVGTTIGFILAFISAYLSNKHFIKTNIVYNTLNVILPILRALPTIIFIYYFSKSYSSNLALYLLFTWFSWLWIHKYMIEIYSSINYYPYYVYLNQGFNRFTAFIKVILPQVNNRFISLYLYSFESNMRWNSLLGTLGFVGIGQLINYAQNNRFNNMGIPVLVIMIFMLFLELFIYLINRYVLVHINKEFDFKKDKFKKPINWQSIIKIILISFLSILFIVCLILLSINQKENINNSIFSSLFNPNWTILNNKDNLFFDVLMLFFQSISIMVIAVAFSLLLIFISSYKLFRYYSLFGIFLTAIIRSIPIIALFFVINPIYSSPTSTICVILGIASATVITKNINESINKIDSKIINYYLMQGYLKITIFFKYILFYIRKELYTITLFEYESKLRDLITYGSFGSSSIGYYIDYYASKSQYNNMTPFIWISIFVTLFIIFTNYLYKYFILEKNSIDLSKFKNIKLFRRNLWK